MGRMSNSSRVRLPNIDDVDGLPPLPSGADWLTGSEDGNSGTKVQRNGVRLLGWFARSKAAFAALRAVDGTIAGAEGLGVVEEKGGNTTTGEDDPDGALSGVGAGSEQEGTSESQVRGITSGSAIGTATPGRARISRV